MNTLAWILGFAALAAAVAIDIWDMRTSLYYPLYTTGEKTKWFRGADGYFSLKRGVIISAIVIGLGIVPVFFFGPWALVCVFGPFALIQFFRVSKNARVQNEAKERQFAALTARNFGSRLIQFNGMFVLTPFYDIQAGNTEYAYRTLIDKLNRLAEKPDSEWWKLDRAKSL